MRSARPIWWSGDMDTAGTAFVITGLVPVLTIFQFGWRKPAKIANPADPKTQTPEQGVPAE